MEVMRYRVKLDMEDSGTLKTQLRLKQGDSAITLVFKIMKNGIDVYNASDVPTVVFKRPDGTSVVGNMSVAEGQYTYTMAGNELQIAGPMTADVKFDVNTARESTCTFGFECVPDTMSPDTNPAGIFVNSLKDIITAVQQGVEKVEQAVEVFDVQQIIDLKNQIEELIEELPDFTIDDEFDTSSEHALQNKVIAEAIDTINDALDSLATVATSGSYNDLSNKPTLSAVATSGSYNDLSNKPTLAAVATSGSYSDLSNKPTIPADVSSRVSALEGKAVDVDVYSASTSYTVGAFLYYSGKIYKVKTACSGVTPPNSTYYEEYTLTSELMALNNSLSNKANLSDAMVKRTRTTTNANGFLSMGVYNVDPNIVTNIPTTHYANLIVFGNGAYISQLFISVTAGDSYTRGTYDGGTTWSAWKKISN